MLQLSMLMQKLGIFPVFQVVVPPVDFPGMLQALFGFTVTQLLLLSDSVLWKISAVSRRRTFMIPVNG
jgi:hypothetical protein